MTRPADHPAFPCKIEGIGPIATGLTIREYAAIQALQGLLANPETESSDPAKLAQWAFDYADALLAAEGEGTP